jgi:hypothetical protein
MVSATFFLDGVISKFFDGGLRRQADGSEPDRRVAKKGCQRQRDFHLIANHVPASQ